MSTSTLDYYAREADRIARGPQLYGGNAAIVQLRCFKYYHPDMGSYITDPEGRARWLGPKASRIFAILDRDSSNGNRLLKMKDIAREAMASTSTVSRTVVRLQAYGLFAIDVIRGRHGGMRVRKRRLGDHLKHYATNAWARIKRLIKVASTLHGQDEAVLEHEQDLKKITESTLVDMDATFMEAWDGAEERARGLHDHEGDAGTPDAAPGRARAWDQGDDLRVARWVADALDEIVRLDQEEPDWDVRLEVIRASYGLESRWPA